MSGHNEKRQEILQVMEQEQKELRTQVSVLGQVLRRSAEAAQAQMWEKINVAEKIRKRPQAWLLAAFAIGLGLGLRSGMHRR